LIIPHVHTIMAGGQQQQQQQSLPADRQLVSQRQEEPRILRHSTRINNTSSGDGARAPPSHETGKRRHHPDTRLTKRAAKVAPGDDTLRGGLRQAFAGGAAVPSSAGLSERSQMLASAVNHLARGIHEATRHVAHRPVPRDPEASPRGSGRCLEMEQELEMHGWQPHGPRQELQSSPVAAHCLDSTRLSFKPQAQQPWAFMARRQIDGSGTETQVGGNRQVFASGIGILEVCGCEMNDGRRG
jgi:hypothetical protein